MTETQAPEHYKCRFERVPYLSLAVNCCRNEARRHFTSVKAISINLGHRS